MRKVIYSTLITCLLLNLTAARLVEAEGEKYEQDITQIINEFIPSNSTLISPKQSNSPESFRLYDFNQDENKEMLITYELKATEQPSPSQFGVILLKEENGDWKKIWETQAQGVGLDYSGLTDITGDGIKEYLFGVTIGASAGNELEIFKWTNNSLKKIANVPYHKIELVTNKNVGLAVWKRFIADTYFVDVLKWNGQQLVHDEELYSNYYPVIEKFHSERQSSMDAWFYWYTLADAQIKANLFDEAENSIQKGIALAKQSSLTEEVKNFNKLFVKLQSKKE